MANYTELNVYKATYSLLYELLAASKSFNRDFKYTLGENLKNEMINAMMFSVSKYNYSQLRIQSL